MEERTILKENGVTVTTARFIVSSQTYAMSGVTSVKEFEERPSLILPVLLMLVGLLMLPAEEARGAAILLLVIGGALLLYRILSRRHHVLLSTASGETRALSSKDREWIAKVVNALNESIVARG